MGIFVNPTWDYVIYTAVVGGGVLVAILGRLGFIKLPKRNRNNNMPKVCPAHESIVKGQTEHTTILKQVNRELKKGSEKFDKFDKKIDDLSVNVGILLDRDK